MTDNSKLKTLKTLLDISSTSEDDRLTEYLHMANAEILNWLYINVGAVPSNIVTVPTRYEQVQIQACIAGYNLSGAENQTSHSENGVSRQFKYEDMIAYIHCHVTPFIGIPGAK